MSCHPKLRYTRNFKHRHSIMLAPSSFRGFPHNFSNRHRYWRGLSMAFVILNCSDSANPGCVEFDHIHSAKIYQVQKDSLRICK